MPVEAGGVEGLHVVPSPPPRPWQRKLLTLCLMVLSLEVGVFLVVFPWLDAWETNRAATYTFWLEVTWGNPYFRGALTGLGLVNIYIALLELLRLARGR
jgi:hypothetical protein